MKFILNKEGFAGVGAGTDDTIGAYAEYWRLAHAICSRTLNELWQEVFSFNIKFTTPSADDYVTDFIKDINRVRVLQVGSIMSDKMSDRGPEIEDTEVIEEALQVLSKNKADTAIVTKAGKPVGSITLDTMIAAIARSKDLKKGGDAYK